MKYLIVIAAFVFSSELNAQMLIEYDAQMGQRNIVYNEYQELKLNDSILLAQPLALSQKADSLLTMDNVLLDEWVPSLLQQNDSLKIEANKVAFLDKEIMVLKQTNEMYFYGAAGAAGLFLIFFILFFVQTAGKRKARRKLKKLHANEKEKEEAVSMVAQLKIDMDEKIAQLETILKEKNELLHTIDEKRSEITRMQSQVQEVDQVRNEFEVKLRDTQLAEEDKIAALKSENIALKIEVDALKQKESEFQNKHDEMTQYDNSNQMGNDEERRKLEEILLHERDENLKKLNENEILLDDLRREIHELRTQLDEKNREEHYERFTSDSDVIEENTKLRQTIDEYRKVIEDYRQTLEKELLLRKEFEIMIRDFRTKN